MSQEINHIFKKYNKIFLNREEEMKVYLSKYFEKFFKEHIIEDVIRIDATDRLDVAGFHNHLSSWRNRGEIILCSCEIVSGIRKRYDYKFMFPEERIAYQTSEEEIDDTSRIKDIPIEELDLTNDEEKSFREFTDEEKEQYRLLKEKEKNEVEETFQNFLMDQSVKNVIEIIEKSQEVPSFQTHETDSSAELENQEELPSSQQIHGYSIRNYLMVLSQARKRQDNNFIGIINSFWNWKKQGTSVLKNPDKSKPYSYKILVPISEGNILKGFKLGSVFDISQTNQYEEYLKQREESGKELLWRDEIEYDHAIEFVHANFPEITINEDLADKSMRGSFDPASNILNVHEKTSHTVFHELGKYISIMKLQVSEDVEPDSVKEEILAEITCYLLMKKFEKAEEYKINYNFGYSNCWALNILDEFKFREFEDIYSKISYFVKNL